MKKQNRTWLDNSIQFPRLLSEIIAVGLTESQWDSLLDSMDLKSDELSQLFDRAQSRWEKIKGKSVFVGLNPGSISAKSKNSPAS